MANISISDLNPSESSIVDLNDGEDALIQASVERALNVRGGLASARPLGPTVGIIIDRSNVA